MSLQRVCDSCGSRQYILYTVSKTARNEVWNYDLCSECARKRGLAEIVERLATLVGPVWVTREGD